MNTDKALMWLDSLQCKEAEEIKILIQMLQAEVDETEDYYCEILERNYQVKRVIQ